MKPKLMNLTHKELVLMVADDPEVGNNKTNKWYREYIYTKFGRTVSAVTITKTLGSLESRLKNEYHSMQSSARRFYLDCNCDPFLARRVLNTVAQ